MAAAMALFMVSLAGFPPTAGFFGKLYVFLAAIKSGYILITIMAVIASVISVYFYLRVIAMMYLQEEDEEVPFTIHKGMGGIITVSAVAILLFGFFPSTLMQLALDSIPF